MRKITFQPQFETALLTETKQQTCRKREKYANVKVGDTVILTIAGGEDIAEANVTCKFNFNIPYLDENRNIKPEYYGKLNQFAEADGFNNFVEFEIFLDKQYGKGMWDLADFDVLYFKINKVLPKKQTELW